MRYLLFDDQNRTNLLPLAYTRPVAEFRVGILTIKEKWAKRMPSNATFSGFVTEEYLQAKFPASIQEDQIWINASICPNDSLVKKITSLNCNQSLYDHSNNIIAFRLVTSPRLAILAILETPFTGSATGIFRSSSLKINL